MLIFLTYVFYCDLTMCLCIVQDVMCIYGSLIFCLHESINFTVSVSIQFGSLNMRITKIIRTENLLISHNTCVSTSPAQVVFGGKDVA